MLSLRSRQTAIWLQRISRPLHDRIAAVGLVEPRVLLTLDEFISDDIERADVVAGTKMNFGTVKPNLVDFYSADKPQRAITTANATEFRQWLQDDQSLAENTIRRRCGRARQFFAAAIKSTMIDENPFAGMPVTVNGSTDKERFATEAESQKILKARPDL